MSSPSVGPKVVLITGCSKGGIGFSLCEEFADRGCIVYATARKVEAIEGLKHAGIHRRTLDVNNEEDVRTTIENIIELEGRIDVLVNNAGMLCVGPTMDISMEQVQKTFDTNVFGALRMAQAVFPHMARRKSGLVINIGSVAGELPAPWNGVYSASKAALHNISDTLAIECKPFGIDVMLVAAGSVQSNLAQNHSQFFQLPPGSLYTKYLDHIVRRMHASQGKRSVPNAEFAKSLVNRALSKPPPHYIRLGGNTVLYQIFGWLPRGLLFWCLWKLFSQSLY